MLAWERIHIASITGKHCRSREWYYFVLRVRNNLMFTCTIQANKAFVTHTHTHTHAHTHLSDVSIKLHKTEKVMYIFRITCSVTFSQIDLIFWHLDLSTFRNVLHLEKLFQRLMHLIKMILLNIKDHSIEDLMKLITTINFDCIKSFCERIFTVL